MSKMDPEIKRKWIEALRSGEYQQGRRKLCRTTRHGVDRMCCLGVLYDVAVDGYWTSVSVGREVIWKADGDDGLLPKSIATSLGVYRWQARLAEMNDGGRSFVEIAHYIEKHL